MEGVSFAEVNSLIEIAADRLRVKEMERLAGSEFISGTDFVAIIELFGEKNDLLLVLAKAQCLNQYTTYEEAIKAIDSFTCCCREEELPDQTARRQMVHALSREYACMLEVFEQEFLETFGYAPSVSNIILAA